MYLGIDLGTSSLKAMLIDDAQNIVGSCSSAIEVSRPQTGWSEQNPADWIVACEIAIEGLKAEHSKSLSAVKGIGLSGHMHGATLIDDSNQVIRPCMLWNDTRSHMQAAKMDGNLIFRKLSGNIVFPGFTAPKVDWVRENETSNFEKIAKVLLPKDYLRLWLTGDHVSEMSDSAGTSWLDVEKRDWSDVLLSACELERSHMPSLVEGSEVSGTLRPELAARFGVSNKTLVAGGAGDNAASAIGMGTVNAGSAFLSLGTSGVLFAANDAYLPNPESAVHTFCHALPDMWHQMGVILSATDSLNWYAKIAGKTPAQLTDALGAKLRAPSKTIFLPYLGGERTPHNDAKVRGGFFNLEHETDQQALTQAVLEGVSFAFLDNMNALKQAGTVIDRVMAIGGGAKSNYWLSLLASVLNIQIEVPQKGEFGAALGAARLGMMAAENMDSSQVCTPPKVKQVISPAKAYQNAFQDGYQRYKSLYS